MKKLLTIAAIVGTASLSFGQGYVGFANTSQTRVSTNSAPSLTGGTTPAALAGGAVGTFYYALLVAPTTQTTIDNSLAGWTYAGMGTNIATTGRMNGNNSPDGLAVQVAGYGPTATANFAVVGWSANIGADYATVLAWWNNGNNAANVSLVAAQYFGISAVAVNIPLAPSGGPYNTMWGSASIGEIPGMALGAYINVPEPSTFALAGLGAAALLIFRRRK